MMNDKELKTGNEKPICDGGVHCLKLEDKEHSTQFIHLNPVNFFFHLNTHTHFLFDLISLLIVDKSTIDLLIHFH
jgi:hypothetical protein